MKINVGALGTLYEMAHEGAQLAANRLAQMTDVPTHVTVTRVDFADRTTVERAIDDGVEKAAVQVDLDGGLEGTSMIVFESDSALTIADTLIEAIPREATEELRTSTILEVGQIMNSGFVDGWANVLDTEVDMEYPRFITGPSAEPFVASTALSAPSDTDLALLFESEVKAVGAEVAAEHYLFPSGATLEMLFDQQDDDLEGIEYAKLAGFDRMADKGAETVAENLSQLTGLDAQVDIRRINFLSLHAIPGSVPNEELVSVAFSFEGILDGYLVFLFDQESAHELATATVNEDSGPGFSPMERDAIMELSNIMASGLLDGWANMLDAAITHSTPAYACDMGAAVVDPLVVGLSPDQEFAFVFDTQITAVDTTLDIDIYAIPDESDLEDALNVLDADRVTETPVTADFAVKGRQSARTAKAEAESFDDAELERLERGEVE